MELLCEIDLQSFLQVNLPTATKALLSGRKVDEKKLFLKDFSKCIKGTGLKVTGTESFEVISCEMLLYFIAKEYG